MAPARSAWSAASRRPTYCWRWRPTVRLTKRWQVRPARPCRALCAWHRARARRTNCSMPSSPIRVSRASPPNGERHMRSVWIGYDPREAEAFAVCRYSIARHTIGLPIHALCLDELRDAGLYWRPTSKRDGKLWDDISDAGMSTEFACSRFLTPLLARTGW